jgi:hypothetical protein
MSSSKTGAALTVLLLIAVPVFYCFKTPIDRYCDINLDGWLKIVVVIPLLAVQAIRSRWVQGSVVRKIMLLASITLLVFASDISEAVFLGNKLSTKNIGQDAGFTELSLYSRGDYKLSLSNAFGSTKNYYGRYSASDTAIFIDQDIPSSLQEQKMQLKGKALQLHKR